MAVFGSFYFIKIYALFPFDCLFRLKLAGGMDVN